MATSPVLSVNARYRGRRMTGTERVASEVVGRLSVELRLIDPPRWATSGLLGHGWEQLRLPSLARGWLFSPCNTGPVRHPRHVVTIYDTAPLQHPEWYSREFASMYRWLTPRLCRSAAHIVTTTPAIAAELCELGADASRVTVIGLGARTGSRRASAEEISSMRRTLLLGDAPYVLALGSIEPRKNLDQLLRAWEIVAPSVPGCSLVLAGAVNSKVFSNGLRSVAGPVKPVGHVPEELLGPLLSGATAFASVSWYEGFGLPPIEALACGTPVVASSIEAHRHTMTGTGAVFVDPASVESIADGLRSVLADPPAVDDVDVRRRFDWADTAARYDQLFRDLLTSASR